MNFTKKSLYESLIFAEIHYILDESTKAVH